MINFGRAACVHPLGMIRWHLPRSVLLSDWLDHYFGCDFLGWLVGSLDVLMLSAFLSFWLFDWLTRSLVG